MKPSLKLTLPLLLLTVCSCINDEPVTVVQYGTLKVPTDGTPVNLEKYFTMSADESHLSVNSILSTVSKKPEIACYGHVEQLVDLPDTYPVDLSWSDKAAIVNGGGYYMREWVYDASSKDDLEYIVKFIVEDKTSDTTLQLHYQMLIKHSSIANK